MSTPTNQDASKILLGSVGSSDRVITKEDADPASFPAGRAVRRTSTEGSLSLASGSLIGVSLGASLSDTKKTAVCRVGNRVPIQLAGYLVKGSLTFIKKTAAVVNIAFITGGVAGSEVVTVTGDTDAGWLISVSMSGGVSTATQMKAALDGSAAALALIETQIASGAGATAQAAFASDEIDGYDHAVIGAAVRVSLITGMAIPTVGALTGACYADTVKDGISHETGLAICKVAPIDMGGGL